ncbi:MAG: PAS domain S-box protein [Bacteroidetes bacterium]|nr:PAS domain S-box protein [Bacteroidota bacterium]
MDLSKQTKQELTDKIRSLQNELEEWKKNFGNFNDLAPDMFFSISPQGKVLDVNRAGCLILGFSEKELLGSSVWNIIHPEDKSKVRARFSQIVTKKIQHSELNFRKIKKSGESLYVQEQTYLVFNKQDIIKEIHIRCTDVTKRKVIEAEVQTQQERFRTLTEHLNVGLYRSTVDKRGTFIEVNEPFLKMLGYRSRDELFDHKVSDIYEHASERAVIQKKIHESGLIKNQEVCLRKKNGETFVASLSTILVRDSHGQPTYYDGIIEDISERKQILNTIRESESKYRSLVESFYDIIFITDHERKMLFANPALKKHTGFTLENFQSSEPRMSFIHPDDEKKVEKFIDQFIKSKNKNSDFFENRLLDKTGKLHWFSSIITKIQYENRPALQFIVRDITSQKLTGENLLKKEKQYGTLFDLSPNGILIEDRYGKILDVNPAFCDLLGYTKSELMGANVKILSHPDARHLVQKNIDRILSGEQLNHTEKSLKKDGTISYVHLNEKKFDLPDGQTGIVCIAEDITDRIRAEKALKESEQKYRLLIENQTDLVVKVDTKGRFTFVSPSYCELFGKTEEELLDKDFLSLVHKDDQKETKNKMEQLLKPPYHVYLEHRAKTKPGWRWIAWMDTAVLDENKQVVEIIGVGRDVTDRKIAEEALLKSEESYRGLFNSATDAIYIQDINGYFLDVNAGAEKMYGYKRSEFIGRRPDFLSAPHKNDLNKIQKYLKAAFAGIPQKFEFWGLDAKGRIFPKEVRMNKSTYFGKEVVVVFAQDITERKAAQKILEEKEKKFRRIFNAFPDIYFKSSIDGTVLEVSPSVLKITGYSPREVIGQKSSKFYYDENEWKNIGDQINKNGEINDFDTRIKTKNNRILYCSLTARTVFNEVNKPIEIEGALRDITDRVQAEKEIKESQRRISTLMANLPGMAYRCKNDREWTMEFISQGCFDLTGYTPEALIDNRKLSFNDLILPDDREIVWKTIQAALKKNKSYRMAYRIIHASGDIHWVWEQGIGIYDADGNLLALEGFISNITEQREAEEEIRKLSRSVEQSPTIIIIANLEGNIEYVNPRFSEVTGYSVKEIIGKNPRILKSGNTPARVYKDLWKSITSGKEWFGELQNRKKNGELYWESANIFPLKDENGKTTHYIGMKEDITERKRMEQELIIAKERAEESDKLKSAFLANMSHEIRTPMNSIIGFSQLLDDRDLTPDERSHFINLIQNSGNDLMTLIDDIIDISKIEAGQMKVFKSQYILDHLMQELYEGFKEHVKTKPKKSKLDIIYSKPEHAEKIIIYTDIDRFKQIFRNLLYNSIKFTDTGYIKFGFEERQSRFSHDILFYVKDTGIGIAPDKKEIIFDSFTQANESDTKLYGGTGLGLAITKRIVELLGGHIWVESEPGKGATFFFTLPGQIHTNEVRPLKNAIKPQDFQVYDWSNKSILVVEDDDSSYDFFERILHRTNAKLKRAEDGLQAIKYFRNNSFDLVLMDIRLPRMDGYKTMKKIKSFKSETPIIAQTAYAMQGEREKCLKSGFDDYISKPVKINDLLEMVNRYLMQGS